MKVIKKVNIIKMEVDLDSENGIKQALSFLAEKLLELDPSNSMVTNIVQNPKNKIKLIKKIRQYGKDCVTRHQFNDDNPSSLRFSKEVVEEIISQLT